MVAARDVPAPRCRGGALSSAVASPQPGVAGAAFSAARPPHAPAFRRDLPLAVCRHGCRRTGFAGGGNGLCGPCRLLLSVAGPVPCVRDAPADPSRAVGCRGTLCPRHCDVAAVPGLLWPGTVHHDKLPGLFAPGVRVMRDGGMCRRRGQSLARASSGGARSRCLFPRDFFPWFGFGRSWGVCRSARDLSGLAAPCMRPSSSPCVSKTR